MLFSSSAEMVKCAGAFSTVRYCKHVQRGTAARLWPEYAAKVLRSQLMKELGYERSVRREIAVLRQLTHPGISRLVASALSSSYSRVRCTWRGLSSTGSTQPHK